VNLKSKLQNILELDKMTVDMGFSKTSLILARNIILDERVRMQCQVNLCGHHQSNLMCPPFLPSLSDNRRLVEKYNFALLVQLHKKLTSSSREENRKICFDTFLEFNEMLVALERKAFGMEFPFALVFGAGECKLCLPCAAHNGENQCRKPGLSRPSMEGMGIDVLQTFTSAGLPMEFKEGELTVAGLLLID
jgi:predicted metal-binding protein